VLIPDPGSALTPGQGVRVRIKTSAAAQRSQIVVPEEAVQSIGGRDCLFVRIRGGFQARPVSLGVRSSGRVEVVNGLDAGAEIATTGAFLLKSELGKEAAEH
jgi:cobalt-zinc-cadmium efflux system membrane fusion protein